MLSGLRTGGNRRYQAIALRIKLEDVMQVCIRKALLSSVKVSKCYLRKCQRVKFVYNLKDTRYAIRMKYTRYAMRYLEFHS